MSKARILGTAVTISQRFVAQALGEGDIAVDATAGNGNDTLFLARTVGPQGQVYAFDIQEDALDKTRRRLAEAGELLQTRLIKDGHENLAQYVQGPVAAIMFNLGYLPRGNHEIITRPETTCRAIEAGLELLGPRGIMSIVVYSGHPGGDREAAEVESMVQKLDQTRFSVLRMDFVNRKHNSPYLILVEKEN
ncbi:MAG: methyltransferase domain-containing protein [Clostridia bacterium]|nr:methyltransferase domain-containing protein [Clostridia bacterium]